MNHTLRSMGHLTKLPTIDVAGASVDAAASATAA
jgi:hypothetical protein